MLRQSWQRPGWCLKGASCSVQWEEGGGCRGVQSISYVGLEDREGAAMGVLVVETRSQHVGSWVDLMVDRGEVLHVHSIFSGKPSLRKGWFTVLFIRLFWFVFFPDTKINKNKNKNLL